VAGAAVSGSIIGETRDMRGLVKTRPPRNAPGAALVGLALGTVATGAFAIGALAVWHLAIRRLAVGNARFKAVDIEDLVVDRLRVGQLIVSDSVDLPSGAEDGRESVRAGSES
jgi:hypothetical protein